MLPIRVSLADGCVNAAALTENGVPFAAMAFICRATVNTTLEAGFKEIALTLTLPTPELTPQLATPTGAQLQLPDENVVDEPLVLFKYQSRKRTPDTAELPVLITVMV